MVGSFPITLTNEINRWEGKFYIYIYSPHHTLNPTIPKPGDDYFVDFRDYIFADFLCPA